MKLDYPDTVPIQSRHGLAEAVPVEQVLIQSPLVTIGRFRLDARHSEFATLGAISRHSFVFPRRAVWIKHRDQPAFVGDPTRVALYNPGAEYERTALDPVGDYSDWFGVDASLARTALAAWDPAAAEQDVELFRRSHAPVGSDLYLRQRRLYQYVRLTDRPDLLHVEESVMHLLADVVGAAVKAPTHTSHTDPGKVFRQHQSVAEAACAVLNRRFWRSESLAAIAEQVGVSVFHLCRVFRNVTGGTIHQHREQLRLRASLQAVMETNEDLLSIGLRLGYSGHSHFTGAFHRRFSITPSALRRMRRRSGVPRDLEAASRQRTPLPAALRQSSDRATSC